MKASACYTFDLGQLGQVDVDVWFTVSPFIPATLYLANGDPGDPAEGGEVELDRVNCPDYPMLNSAIHEALEDDADFLVWAYEHFEGEERDFDEERDAA